MLSGRIWVPHGNVGADVMVEGGSVVVVEVVTVVDEVVVEDDADEDEDNDNDDDECDVDVVCVVVELTEGTGALSARDKSHLKRNRINESFELRTENHIFGTTMERNNRTSQTSVMSIKQLEVDGYRVDPRDETLKAPQQHGAALGRRTNRTCAARPHT